MFEIIIPANTKKDQWNEGIWMMKMKKVDKKKKKQKG